jgi:hypothetical protein
MGARGRLERRLIFTGASLGDVYTYSEPVLLYSFEFRNAGDGRSIARNELRQKKKSRLFINRPPYESSLALSNRA